MLSWRADLEESTAAGSLVVSVMMVVWLVNEAIAMMIDEL